jgi:hypothetical protein
LAFLCGFRRALILTLLATPAAALPPAAETGPCSLEKAVPATLAVLDDDFELLLDDGRRVALAGLEFAASEPLRAAAARKLSDALVGRQVFVDAQSPDRWGRAPALLFFAEDVGSESPLVSAGAAMIEAGYARFRPDAAAAECASSFLAAEAGARAAKRGLWSGRNAAVFNLGSGSSSIDRTASAMIEAKGMVIVEGVIHSLGEARGTTYLNFGPRRGSDFSVVISKRDLAIFERSGVSPRRLIGRHVRVRGLIETSFGARMELSSPAQIELIGSAAAP